MTNEIDVFFRQARRTAAAAAVLKYGKVGQRSMAEKDAISCQCFGETNDEPLYCLDFDTKQTSSTASLWSLSRKRQ